MKPVHLPLLPLGLLPLVQRANGLPPCQTLLGRDPITTPLPQHWWSRGGGGGNSVGGTSSHWPSCSLCWPLGKLSASDSTVGGPPIPCCMPQLTLPTRSFKGVNFKGSGEMYICEWCKMQTSSWAYGGPLLSGASWICLVCPHRGINYLDLSKFHLHSRWIHNLLFYLNF